MMRSKARIVLDPAWRSAVSARCAQPTYLGAPWTNGADAIAALIDEA